MKRSRSGRTVPAPAAAIPLTPPLEPRVASPAPAAPPAGLGDLPLDSLVVGRRRERRVEIRLALGSLTRLRTRAYVLGLFQDVSPAGASLAMDAVVNGAVTEFAQRRMFSNGVGELFLLPRGRTDLRADFLIFAGMGPVDRFNAQVVETVAENLARSLVRADIEEFGTVLVGANAGVPMEDGVQAYLRGLLRGLVDADREQKFRAMTLCEIDETRYAALKWALYRLSSTRLFDDVELVLDEVDLPVPAAEVAVDGTPRRTTGLGTVPTLYLQVRSEPAGRGVLRLVSSVLTSGAKATVITGEREVPMLALGAHLQRIEQPGFSHGQLPAYGRQLAELVLPADVLGALEGSAGQHLVVVHDAEASRVPWETLTLGDRSPALDGGLSRRYMAANLSVAKWLEQRRREPGLQVLLVVNPTGDLDGAEAEYRRIIQLCDGNRQIVVTTVKGAEATRERLLQEFGSGRYDVLHYAGHASFHPQRPAQSGLLCSDGSLTGADLVALAKLPSLVFFNACESARVRRNVVRTEHGSRDLADRIARTAGLAEAFLRGGVANYLGTYWPVGDRAAEVFACDFYSRLLKGEPIGRAVQGARGEVHQLKSPDWADYIHYGAYEFELKK